MRAGNNLVSFIVITYNRKDDLKETLNMLQAQNYHPIEIIVVDNNSSDGTEKLFKTEFTDPSVRYIRLLENKGVAGGRNAGLKEAKGEIIICIDDDALLMDNKATHKVVHRFSQDNQLGVLAFKSVNYYTKEISREEFPHRDKSLNPDTEFETSYFIGVGHAIKKEVYERVGLYPEDFFYAFEELDLSFRILDAGYKIIYFPSVKVLHKKSSEGRVPTSSVWIKMLENRMRTSIRNLPWRYVLGSSLIWTGYILFRTRGNVLIIWRAYRNLIQDLGNLFEERSPIRPQTVRKLRELEGRLLY